MSRTFLRISCVFCFTLLLGLPSVRVQAQVFNIPPGTKPDDLLTILNNPIDTMPNPLDQIGSRLDTMMDRSIETYTQQGVQNVLLNEALRRQSAAGSSGLTAPSGLSAIDESLNINAEELELNREALGAVDANTQRYNPRLEVDFREFPRVRERPKIRDENLVKLKKHLEKRLGLKGGIELVPEGEEIVIRGTVDSERQARLVRQVAMTTPGIDRLRDELKVLPSLGTPELPRR